MKVLKTLTPIPREKLSSFSPALEEVGKNFGLSLIIIFGSLAKGKMLPLSDVDIAFLSKKKLDLDEYLELLGKFQDIFKREDIDLTDLAKASPLLKMCVLTGGIVTYKASSSELAKFRYQTISNFLATQYLRSQFSNYLNHAVLGGA